MLVLSLAVMAGAARAAEPAKAPVWDADAARHLLSRAAFGGSPEEANRLAAMPLEEAVTAARRGEEEGSGSEVWKKGGQRWKEKRGEE